MLGRYICAFRLEACIGVVFHEMRLLLLSGHLLIFYALNLGSYERICITHYCSHFSKILGVAMPPPISTHLNAASGVDVPKKRGAQPI